MDKEEIVKLAYRLILGRYPGPDEDVHVKNISNYKNIDDIRQVFFESKEFINTETTLRLISEFYKEDEFFVRNETVNFEKFMFAGEFEKKIEAVVSNYADTYSKFHAKRFFDQIRILLSIRSKYFHHLNEVRVLEIGPATICKMYGDLVDGLDFYTGGIAPDKCVPGEANKLYNSNAHYFVNLEKDNISDIYPELTKNPFHVIIFCEVLEHVRASPRELLSDMFKILAPDGAIILSTPNARSEDRMTRYLMGESPQEIYEKSNSIRFTDYHMHVREFTVKEIITGIEAAGGDADFLGIFDYFSEANFRTIRQNFIGARDQLTFVISKKGACRSAEVAHGLA